MTKLFARISAGLMAVGLMALPFLTKAADFDATDTQATLTTALGVVTPTLKAGIIAILAIVLSIWAIFFVVGKLKKHVK